MRMEGQLNLDKHKFLEALGKISGENVISDRSLLTVYEADGLTAKKQLPWLVVLPREVQEVQEIVRLCHQHDVPVVARGAGTGLSGGATPHAEGVLLSLARFNRIVSVDFENELATVEPGVTNLAISDAVREQGFFYAPDPSSQIACTIGGNVAENSGGVHCLKYGLTVHNVVKLKLISPEGELYELGSEAFDSPGYDLLALLHGSEGMLGIVIEVTVKLTRIPDAICVVMAGFTETADAANSVSDIIARGILPAGLEMMDQPAIHAAEAFVSAGYPLSAGALLLCELDGHRSELEQQITDIKAIFENRSATSVEVAFDGDQRDRLWLGRKAAFPAVGRLAPDYYCMDGTIPRRQLATVLAKISELSTEFELKVANVFHAGDGNLHPLILYDANNEGELQRAEAFGARILTLCIDLGGTITGEHGVGIEKIDQMCVQFSSDELSLFHGIKAVFDSTGILNPGKAVPTLSRCAEFGAMHVHASAEEKFPGLERF